MKILVLLVAALLVAGCGEKSSGKKPKPLSDDDIERLLKVAVEQDSLQKRNDLRYQVNKSKPYNGWVKGIYDSGQVSILGQVKDGKKDGLWTLWHENGQKSIEATFKDGEKVSGKYWNNKGEEVDLPKSMSEKLRDAGSITESLK